MRYFLTVILLFTILSFDWNRPRTVAKVVDLRTIVLDDGTQIFLKGIAPIPDREDAEKGVLFVRGMLQGRQIFLEFDEPMRKSMVPEAYVWFEIFPDSHLVEDMILPQFYETREFDSPDGKRGTYVFLNATLIKAGYALPAPFLPHPEYAVLFQEMFRHAQTSSGVCYDTPVEK